MRPTPEAVIELASKIVDLKRQLADAQRRWDAMFPEEESSSATLTAPAMTQRYLSRPRVQKSSEAGKMLLYIDESPGTDFHPMKISNDLGISLQTTRSNLSRLLEKGLIERRGTRGFYGALTTEAKEAL